MTTRTEPYESPGHADPDAGSGGAGAPLEAKDDLGRLGDVLVEVHCDPAPWRLAIDTLVISAAPSGLGQLGVAVRAEFPGPAWKEPELRRVAPDSPKLLMLPTAGPGAQTSTLRRVILACAREIDSSAPPSDEGPATFAAIRRATTSALDLAIAQGTTALGLPLLGAGAIGFPPSEVAFEVVPAVRAILRQLERDHQSATLTQLIFVCRDHAARRATRRVWHYQLILGEVQAQVLRDEALLAEAAQAGLGAEDLARALDVSEEALWQPCSSELTQLRHVDAELDDLRRSLVGSLEQERLSTEQDQAIPGTLAKTLRRGHTTSRRDESLVMIKAAIKDTLLRDPRWRELIKTREAALIRLRDAVRQESLLPRLRATINDGLVAQREATMAGRRAEFRRKLLPVVTTGLRGSPRPGALVQTAAYEELKGLMDPARSPRASVGVAGPRGSGKSTLLKDFSDGWPPNGLSVLVPAPASYESRDFLMHLYSEICQAVLGTDLDVRVRLGDARVAPGRFRTAGLLGLVILPGLALVAGIAALAASGVWHSGTAGVRSAGGAVLVAALLPHVFLLLPAVSGRRKTATDGPDAPPQGLLLRDELQWHLPGPRRVLLVTAAVGVIIVAASLDVLTVRRTVGLALAVSALGTGVFWPTRRASVGTGLDPEQASSEMSPSSQPDPGSVPPIGGDVALSTHLDLARRTVFLIALAAAQLTVALAGIVLIVFNGVTAPVDDRLVVGCTLIGAGLGALLPGLGWNAGLDHELRARLAPPTDPFSFRARQDLDKIRYQRSVSSGWTSSMKLSGASWMPFGVEAGVSGSTTEADVPLSVPEIVESIKRLLPARGPAVLAIDELDKIESVDQARDFLNEIKGILEAPNTRCLVSMSEDAIARFERRGLPFRDVFDSAFDEVVRVPYLSAAQSRALLNQRVTNVPEPFLALAYCMSGGLPRDLLRAADRLISHASVRRGGVSLAEVARVVVHKDMTTKTDAVTSAMKRITVEPEVSALLRSIYAIDVCRPDGARGNPCLLDEAWLAAMGRLSPIVNDAEAGDLAERRELMRLGIELVGYLYYCRTLLELFCTDTDDHVDRLIRLVSDDDGRGLDDLGLARQNFAVNPFVAWDQLDALRKSAGLSVCDLPAPFVVSTTTTTKRASGPKRRREPSSNG